MDSKVLGYLGFAQKAGKLACGYNTCILEMKKGKVHLLIITSEVGENSRKKLTDVATSRGVSYRLYGRSEEVSKAVGKDEKGIFAIKDKEFAKVIIEQIDKSLEGEMFDG